MEKERIFLNIREIAQGQGNPDSPVFGTSTITFCDSESNKATRRTKEILDRCIQTGILDASVQVGNRALVHDLNGMAFVELTVPSGVPYYTQARVLSGENGTKYQYGTSVKLKEVDNFTVISGPCLFSAPSAQAIDKDGKIYSLSDPLSLDSVEQKITDVRVDSNLQPYEIDAILRLTQVISSLNKKKNVTVALNIPRLEYWFYALDLYERGLFEQSALGKWFSEVNKRAAGLENLIQRRLPPEFNVSKANPLTPVEQRILEGVKNGGEHLFEESVDVLRDNPIWNYAISREEPKRFSQLGYLSYPMAHLLTIQNKDQMTVVVESPEETKIMDKTLKLIKGTVDSATVLGLYPHSNLLIKGNQINGNGKRFLYYYGSQGSSAEKREIIEANRK